VSHLNAPRQRWLDGRHDRKDGGRAVDARHWPAFNTRRPRSSFQVTVRGALCDVVRVLVGGASDEVSRETVLTDLRVDEHELRALVGRAEALGVEIVAVRRLSGR
jgi:hypothetical protein